MNVAIADLQNVSVASRDGNRQSVNHSHTVVDSLRTRLKDTTKQFKDVLTIRQENLKAHQGRRQLFSAVGERPSGICLLCHYRCVSSRNVSCRIHVCRQRPECADAQSKFSASLWWERPAGHRAGLQSRAFGNVIFLCSA